MSGKLSHHLFFLRIRPVCVHYQTDIIDADQQSYNRRVMQKNTVLADIFRTLATVKPSMPQFLKCMAPVDLSVNCTALDERLTVSADMEKEGV